MGWKTAAVGSLVVLATLRLGRAAPPAADPTTRPTADPVALRDYCTVLLAPRLQDKLATTAEQQSNLAELGVQLRADLDNAAGNFRAAVPTPGLVAARGEVVLGKVGGEVRDALTPAQRGTLAGMFADQTLQPIGVSAHVRTTRRVGRASVATGIDLKYTHYGELIGHYGDPDGASSTAGSAPPAATPAPAPSPPVGGGPSPGRLRRMPHVDVAAAVRGLQAESLASQVVAASELSRAVPDDEHRPAVLAALGPYVSDAGDEHWAAFAVAFCRWADPSEMPTVRSILTVSDAQRAFDQRESSSAAACTALLRLDPRAAVPAINARVNSDLFRVHLINGVRDLAEQGGADKSMADDVLDQLMRHNPNSPPISIHVQLPTPAPVKPVRPPLKV